MAIAEKDRLPDPLIVLNQHAINREIDRSWFRRVAWWRHKLDQSESAGDAATRLMEYGQEPPGSNLRYDNRAGISDVYGEYLLAQTIRATKLSLAEKGRLQDYTPGVWLMTISIPQWLRPTKVEITEAREWVKKEQDRLNQFTDKVLKAKELTIGAGREIFPDTVLVYPFQARYIDDLITQESFPLVDVMRNLAATQDELMTIVGKPSTDSHFDRDHYEGLHTPTGKQRIADFFHKPVSLFLAGEVLHAPVKRYGIIESKTYVDFEMPCSEGRVEPTETRLEKLGLKFARA